MGYRKERDSMGEILVPDDRLYGAQTQRSLQNFKIGTEKMPLEIIRAVVTVKAAAAEANFRAGKLIKEKAEAIKAAADRILKSGDKTLSAEFPLAVWQTGSGTQSNMNVNEVIAHMCPKELAVHPNDDVNMSQSTNDVFPTALHISAVTGCSGVLKSTEHLISVCKAIEKDNAGVAKTGRTHLMDATPMLFSQEVGGWRGILETAKEMLEDSLKYLFRLPIGGTAVGTGINAPDNFGKTVAKIIADKTGLAFCEDKNKFHGLSSKDALVNYHAALKNLAAGLMKIANDVRWLASGPRTGLAEVSLPENEPGSSIMPGKVNPTQSEALTMIACEVIGNDVTVSVAGSQGNFQLNVFMPVIGFKVTESARLLADGMHSFGANCLSGLRADKTKMQEYLEKSLMLATALTPVIGYDKASAIVKKAHKENKSLREAGLELGLISSAQFDEIIAKATKF